MKNLLLTAAVLAMATCCMLSCKETDQAVNVANNEILRDTLKKIYPSLLQSQIRIEVHEFRDITVLLGDKQLFGKTDEELKEISGKIGKLTYDIYIENNYLDKGKVIFTPVETRVTTADDPKKEFDINYEDYKEEK